jgi:sterol desaturase/sphingolipid hydroxylase (fatty acid hydroxylase superfamily)
MANITGTFTAEMPLLEALHLRVEGWELWQHVAFVAMTGISMMGLQYLQWDGSRAVWQQGKPFAFGNIPAGGQILTDNMLHFKDFLWTGINNIVLTPMYVLHTMRYVQTSSGIDWHILPNIFLPLQFLSVLFLYDAMYVPLHWLAHVPALYPYVHKHHHRQNSPFRGMWDGVNVNPVEYMVGTYLHIVSLALTDRIFSSMGLALHWSISPLLLALSALMASLNHTRHDVRFLAPLIFDVRDHSVHHAWPRSNYGQFTMWWDRIYGCYMSYDDFKARKERGSVH